MSFGFSISDFISCAQITWQVYDALKKGPAECQAFAEEFVLFHQVLVKMSENLRDVNRRLSMEEHDALSQHIVGFEKLCSLIMGSNLRQYRTHGGLFGQRGLPHNLNDPRKARDEDVSGFISEIRSFSERIRTASFAKKIPKFQRAITAQVEKLTSFNVLLIQYPFFP